VFEGSLPKRVLEDLVEGSREMVDWGVQRAWLEITTAATVRLQPASTQKSQS